MLTRDDHIQINTVLDEILTRLHDVTKRKLAEQLLAEAEAAIEAEEKGIPALEETAHNADTDLMEVIRPALEPLVQELQLRLQEVLPHLSDEDHTEACLIMANALEHGSH
jgi:hypothetical protein